MFSFLRVVNKPIRLIIDNVLTPWRHHYDKGHYEKVIQICTQLLEHKNYDPQIIWETTYRLALAYARTKNEKFFEHINYFKTEESKLNYYFLLGFYYRQNKNADRALEYFYKALGVYSDHSISKREVVSILLSKGKYAEALTMAKENYAKKKTNVYHIQSYFIALIRQGREFSSKEIGILEDLMHSVRESIDSKADDILRCMEGEFEFYVNQDLRKAIEILQEAQRLNANTIFPKKSLLEIYKRMDMRKAYQDLEVTLTENMDED